MKKTLTSIFVLTALFLPSLINLHAQEGSFPVTIDKVLNGKITLDPAPPADGRYAAGTVVTVKATPDKGFVLDSVYFIGNDSAHGTELWKSDGTPQGTSLVKDIYPGSSGSYPFIQSIIDALG